MYLNGEIEKIHGLYPLMGDAFLKECDQIKNKYEEQDDESGYDSNGLSSESDSDDDELQMDKLQFCDEQMHGKISQTRIKNEILNVIEQQNKQKDGDKKYQFDIDEQFSLKETMNMMMNNYKDVLDG